MAVLSLGGNIVTSWSWFGVNELGIGLHAYGGAETSNVMMALGIFALSQVLLIVMGSLPMRFWWSVQAERAKPLSSELA